MGFASVLGESAPALLIEFGKMRLVLGVNDVGSVTVCHYHIG
jgi:hypothetical protein